MKITNRQPRQTADVSAERGTAFRELRNLTLLLIILVVVLFLSVGLVYRVYGRTDGVDRLFQMLRDEKGTPPEWMYMFATHPSPAQRIAELQAYAESLTRE